VLPPLPTRLSRPALAIQVEVIIRLGLYRRRR